MKYHYYIVYEFLYEDGNTGTGSSKVTLNYKLNTNENIISVSQMIINERNFKSVIIINFIRLKE